jgi:hypothetical protein
MNSRVPLPAGTSIGKSFEYGVDINLGTDVSPVFQPVRRMDGFNKTDKPQTSDARTYDDFGAENNDTTGWGVDVAFNVLVNRLTSGLYLPEIEALEARIGAGATGEGAVIEARWYHKPESGTPNPHDAGRGFFTVARTRQNTGAEGANEKFGYTLTGKGEYIKIANPFAGWGVTAPVVSYVTPPLAGDNELITINGTGMLGATAVTIGGAAVEFLPIGAGTIAAQLPTGDAGTVNIIVTTPGGVSTAFPYLRAA